MATLESVCYEPQRARLGADGILAWSAISNRPRTKLPQIVWSDNSTWREANLWALALATDNRQSIKTVWTAMKHLHAYANWLERSDTKWWDFPDRESDRCLVRYRGSLIEARNSGSLAPTTTSQRMAAAIRFYRWLIKKRLITSKVDLWTDRPVGILIKKSFGYTRSLIKNSSELTIPCRTSIDKNLEGGLIPLGREDVKSIINYLENNASPELYLMVRLGLSTGMRFGTIAGLRVRTISDAKLSSQIPGHGKLSVGPGALPPVPTKYSVTGEVYIPLEDLELMKDYCISARRIKRTSLAADPYKDMVFLNRYGRPYGVEGGDFSQAIAVELCRVRQRARRDGLYCLEGFHFHQTRCTFATELARAALPLGISFAISIVKDALMHKNEETSLKYVKFVERDEAMAKISDEFTIKFLTGRSQG